MPFGGAEFYGPKTGRDSETAYYYVEVLPGETGPETYGGKSYKLHHKDTSPGTGYIITPEDNYDIAGFTYVGFDAKPTRDGEYYYNNAKFFYTRNEYTIEFRSGSDLVTTVTKKYEQDISDAHLVVPNDNNKPAGKEDFTFVYWCIDAAATAEYDFTGKTMPAKNLVVYARWEAPTFMNTVFITVSGTGGSETIKVEYGKTIKKELQKLVDNRVIVYPDGDDWTFAGWVTKDENGNSIPFNTDTKIYKPYKLYPSFTNKNSAGVSYVEGTHDAYTDGKTYMPGTQADVQKPMYEAPTGKVFLGWATTPTGDAEYQPNDKLTVPAAGATLYAVYGDKEKTVELTYDPNGGTGTPTTIRSLLNNGKVTVKTAEELSFSRLDYEFAGWNTKADGSGTSFAAGADARVNKKDSNVLYAQWTPAPKYTVEYYYEQSDNTFAKEESRPDQVRQGTTGAKVSVTGDDMTPQKDGYAFDATNKNNVLSGTIAANGSLVLKVYFKLSTAKYTIHHYLAGTTTKVAPDETGSKTIGASLSKDDSKGAAFYPEFAGKLTIKEFDDGTSIVKDETKNVIRIFYYTTLTLTAGSDSKPYDGDPLTCGTFTAEGLINGDTQDDFSVAMTDASTITDAGSTLNNIDRNKIIYSGKVNSAGFVPDYYDVVLQPGKLTVTADATEIIVKVKGNTNTVTYNGSEQSVTDFEVTDNPVNATVALKPGKTAIAKGTNVGKHMMNLTAADFTATSQNYSNIKIEYTDGSLEITKAALEITADSDSKIYDGEALTKNTYVSTALANGDTIESVTVTGSQTEAGSSDNVASAAVIKNANGEIVTDNYDITYKPGTLTVTQSDEEITVTVAGNTNTVTYNGEEQSVTDFEVTDNPVNATVALKPGKTAIAKGTNVGKHEMGLTAEDFTATSPNYSNIKIEYTDGSLEITKAALEITADSDSKIYDGEALTKNSVSSVGLVGGDKIESVTVTGSQTDVGSSDNVASVAVIKNASGKTVTGNYKITYKPGTLEVTPVTAQVTVKVYEASSNVTYDGQPHSIHGYTKMEADNPLYAATTANIKVTETAAWTATGTDAGEYEVGIEPGDFQNTNGNFTNVVFEIVHGKLVIEKAETIEIELKGNTDSKVYNGSEQSVKDITVVNNPANATWSLNEGKEAKASGTDAGKYMMGLTAADFTATSPNYKTVTVKYTDGWLEITPITKEVTVTVTGATKTAAYNRAEQSVTGHTVNTNGLPITVTLNAAGKDTVSGTNAGTYRMGLTAADFTATSRNYTNIKLIVNDGWLKIDPITTETTVYVYGNTDYRYYNRNIQTVEGFEVGYGTDPTISVKLADGKKAIAAGRTVKTYIMGLTEKHFVATSPNYTNIKLVVEDGWLAILPNPDEIVVTIRGNSDTVTYDGKEHTVTGYTVEVEDEVFAIELRTKGKDTAKGTEPGTYNMGLTAADFRVESKNYSNVKVIVEDGALKIEPVTGPTPTPDPTEPTPTPELEDIEDPGTPTTGYTSAWALVNLICAILTVIFSVVLLIGLAGKKTKTEEAENGEEVEKEIKKKKFWRFFSIVPALAAVIVFLLTEDMRLPMVFVDRWTLLMVIIGLVQGLVMVFAKKTKKDPDEEEEAKA